MNRRNFFGSAIGVGIAVGAPAVLSAAPLRRLVFDQHFERCNAVETDVSVWPVAAALAKLGWEGCGDEKSITVADAADR